MSQTPTQIAEFLNKLNNDAAFRDELKNDPAAVFARYGIPYDPNDLPLSQDIELPAIGEVAANYSLYESELFPNSDFASHELLINLTP